jgi:hypothetical protein
MVNIENVTFYSPLAIHHSLRFHNLLNCEFVIFAALI